ncbi:universal stress protein [Mucilaginibacter sp.]|uniref:universal stress protein n=1 Tax=Mucilaginibacter sp. TaxID=1882438 RepID=UPI002844FF31|nr:universal stress protein [Mucilaginibacter sp.]MDR3695961.1 universal stress protein [Mucilaginibacter sp.]
MKTLLIATDFSAKARHAAEYANKLAVQLKANLVLCNAFIVPAEVPEAGLVTWPMMEYEEMLKDSEEELKALRASLKKQNNDTDFQPSIQCENDVGAVTAVVNDIVEHQNIQMVVMATHGNNGLSQFLVGNHTRRMIDEAICPLLLVPETAAIKTVKKIAFATDFLHHEKDLETIYNLIELIRPLNAELLITHILDEKEQSPQFKQWLDHFLVELSNKANYPNIYYRVVKSDNPERGLEWLCEHGHVDMLAMVHRGHNILEKIFTGSHTQKMAGHSTIPLLVIPEPA